MVKELKEALTENKGFVFSSVENVKASEIDNLRKSIRHSGSRYMVIKNRLAGIALKQAGMSEFIDDVKENKILGIGLIKEDPIQIVKLMVGFSKKNSGFKVSRGFLDGQPLAAERIKKLSELPEREQLIAMVVNMINAPLSSFAGVLGSILRSLLYALNAVKEKKENV